MRVATWNVQGIGAPGTYAFDAAVDVLRRLDADVVGLNEVDVAEHPALREAAAALGYPHLVLPEGNPFGETANAVLSRFEVLSFGTPGSPELSGDPDANDLTRLPVLATVAIPGADLELTVVSQHWKSGFEEVDGFRRAVDGRRTAQAAESGLASDLLVVMGDVNQEVDEVVVPSAFTSLPGGLPFSYTLGDDLADGLDEGLANDPFGALTALGLTRVDARQRDGSAATRPSSGRRIDHVFVGPGVAERALRAEIYDSQDEGTPGLAAAGEPAEASSSAWASDHLPVLIAFEVTAR